VMDWLFEASRDVERRFPWISIPGVASKMSSKGFVSLRLTSQ